LIHQDAEVYRIRLQAGQEATHQLRAGRGLWLQVINGPVKLNGTTLQAGDGGSTEVAGLYTLQAEAATEALLFDLQ
jgi:redox-sensitive bicupin YhaK (pirin superfamily)